MTITALIPAKSVSRRCAGKNNRAFGDTSLLRLKIEQAIRLQHAGVFNHVVVSSDSEQYLKLARSLGAFVQRRPVELCSDGSMTKAYNWMAGQIPGADLIVQMNCTCPFVRDETVRGVISMYDQLWGPELDLTGQFDSVVTAKHLTAHLWGPAGQSINFDSNLELPRTQDLPWYRTVTWGVVMTTRLAMMSNCSPIGSLPFFIDVRGLEAIDIDTEEDFRFAEMLYKEGLR